MYKVIKFFTDLQDHGRPYHVGDEFPRAGISVSEKRLAELAGSANKQGVPLIKKVEAVESLDSALTPAEPEVVRQEAPHQEEEKPASKPKPKRAPSKRKKETE